MKTSTILGIFCICLIACHSTNSGTIAETVLIDQTDIFLAKANISEIMLPLDIENHTYDNLEVRIQPITDFDVNTVTSVKLPAHAALLSNPTERQSEIEAFKTSVSRNIDSISSTAHVKATSNIYSTLIAEANRLSKLSASKKALIVYSDLFEHTDAFSIYNDRDRLALQYYPLIVRGKFIKRLKPLRYDNLFVYIIYKPSSATDNEQFVLMSSLFKSILESNGANVYIGSNLIEP